MTSSSSSTTATTQTTLAVDTKQYAQVLVDLDAKTLDRRTFTYSIPPELTDAIEIGLPVKVPFGHMREITGYVVGFTPYVSESIKVKPISDILDDSPLFDLKYLQFLDWVANYYVTPLMTVLGTALPPSLLRKSSRKAMLTQPFSPEQQEQIEALGATEKLVISTLWDKKKPLSVQNILQKTKLPTNKLNAILAKLKKLDLVTSERHQRDALEDKTATYVEKCPAETATLNKRQLAILEKLPEHSVLLKEALQIAGTTKATLQKLAEAGAIKLDVVRVNRDRQTVAGYNDNALTQRHLTDAQRHAYEEVLESESGTVWQLYGVTGSGKTEIYLHLTQQALKHGQSVLVLLPEITLTSHLARRFIDAFGKEQVVLWHSQLSQGEKVDAWRRIANGELKIVIGARSAIFTPMAHLGYVIIDESHESSFKQESPAPRYNAITLAKYLAHHCGTKVVLGSATPDVSDYYQADTQEKVLTLPGRYAGRPMAAVELVDLNKNVQLSGERSSLSSQLVEALRETIENKQQAILLLNRRGFQTFIQCQTCNSVYQCPNCAVSLTYHIHRENVRCHYCGYEENKPKYCKECASYSLGFMGAGTQKLEVELANQLPNARILRLDGDVMSNKMRYKEILDAFRHHEADILLGTQMIAKGLDIPNVTMVGVVGPDMILNMPDYRAHERGFQLLTQVAGRAGRGELAGKVLIQSWQVDHPVFAHVIEQDFLKFYQDELARRQEWNLPPFSQLFRIIVSSPDEFSAQNFLKALSINFRLALKDQPFAEAVELLGPAPCLINRLQGRYRFHLLIKNRAGEAAHQLVAQFFKGIQPPEAIQCILDVDALSLF